MHFKNLKIFKVSQYWASMKFQPWKCQMVLFLTVLFQNTLSKLVSSHCKGKTHSKGRSIKLLPRPARPKENMRDYSASQHYMAQMEFCSFGTLLLKSSCQINTQNKRQSFCRNIYAINDNAECITVWVKTSVMASHHLTDVSCCSPTLKGHTSQSMGLSFAGSGSDPLQAHQCEGCHMNSKAAQIRALNQCSKSHQKLMELPIPLPCSDIWDMSGWCKWLCCTCNAFIFGFWSFQSLGTRTLVLSAAPSTMTCRRF